MSYEIIKRSELAKNALTRFKYLYFDSRGGHWAVFTHAQFNWPKQPEQIYADMLAAGDDPEAVERAMPNLDWTRMQCAECRQFVTVGVAIRGEYDGGTELCLSCIKKIAAELEEAA